MDVRIEAEVSLGMESAKSFSRLCCFCFELRIPVMCKDLKIKVVSDWEKALWGPHEGGPSPVGSL